MNQFHHRVGEIVEDYLNAFQVPYDDLAELEAAERQDLLNTLMEELGIVLQVSDLARLLRKTDLKVEDIVESLEYGDTMGYEEY